MNDFFERRSCCCSCFRISLRLVVDRSAASSSALAGLLTILFVRFFAAFAAAFPNFPEEFPLALIAVFKKTLILLLLHELQSPLSNLRCLPVFLLNDRAGSILLVA